MSNIRVAAQVFLVIGILVLAIGLYIGGSDVLTYQKTIGSIIGHSYDAEVFWHAAPNYIIGGILGIAVGCVLFVVPDKQGQTIVQVIPPPPQDSPVPLPSTAICPSCGRNMVYVSQYQRWYCPEEKKYI